MNKHLLDPNPPLLAGDQLLERDLPPLHPNPPRLPAPGDLDLDLLILKPNPPLPPPLPGGDRDRLDLPRPLRPPLPMGAMFALALGTPRSLRTLSLDLDLGDRLLLFFLLFLRLDLSSSSELYSPSS